MNANEISLLLDTLLKVMAFAAITLACVWMIRKWKHPHSTPQNPGLPMKPAQRKIHILEEISANVGTVNHSFAKYSALVIESTRFGQRWPPARKMEFDKINSELVKEFDKLSDAEAKLLMLGEKTMEKTLRLYGAKIAFFRKQVYVGRQDITEQEIAELKTAIMQLRERFYDILSHRYDKLLSA